MKICFFTKYPPTEGGVSSQSYWLARELGERGVEVHLVTNALEEKTFREKINFENQEDLLNYQPKNVYVHSLDAAPKENGGQGSAVKKNDESRLASLGIEVVERYRCDLISSFYFLPFGIAAYMASQATGRPLVMRHAGSDLARVTSEKAWHPLFKKIFSAASLIFTRREKISFFLELGIPQNRLCFGLRNGPSSAYFNPDVGPADLGEYGIKIGSETPVIVYVGKINETKGIYYLAEAASRVDADFLLLFVGCGPGAGQFKEYLGRFRGLDGKCHFLEAVPPWRIPAILKRSLCLAQLETGFPFVHHRPIQPFEAAVVGRCSLVSQEIYQDNENLAKLEKDREILVVDPKDPETLKEILERIVKNKSWVEGIGANAHAALDSGVFAQSVSEIIEIYETIIKERKSFKACLENLKDTLGKCIKYL